MYSKMVLVHLFVYRMVHLKRIYKPFAKSYGSPKETYKLTRLIYETYWHQKRPLSDTTLENPEAENTLYREKDSENLYFQVKPTGAKSWVMRYKEANGKWSWHGLGAYPRLTGANARKLYREKLAELANGAQALQAKQLDPNAKTFKAIAMEWYQTPKIKP
mgnify:CR=1 FL=1